jgi:hypothetical protein
MSVSSILEGEPTAPFQYKDVTASSPVWLRAKRRLIDRRIYYEQTFQTPLELEMRRQLAWWLYDQHFDCMATINTNQATIGFARARHVLSVLGAATDWYFLGRHWHRFNSAERTFFVAVPERGGGELHYHVLLRKPGPVTSVEKMRHLEEFLSAKLKRPRLFPAGDVDVRLIKWWGNPLAAEFQHSMYVLYCMKRLWRKEHWDNVVFSSEFHHAPK